MFPLTIERAQKAFDDPRFAMSSMWFMNAYFMGLTGTQAAWVAKKYWGHRTIPADILAQFDKALTKNN